MIFMAASAVEREEAPGRPAKEDIGAHGKCTQAGAELPARNCLHRELEFQRFGLRCDGVGTFHDSGAVFEPDRRILTRHEGNSPFRPNV